LINESIRLPLTALSSQHHELIRKAMLHAGITI